MCPLSKFIKSSSQVKFEISIPAENEMVVKVAYPLYWKAFINGKEIKVKRCADDVIELSAPPGNYILELRFEPVRFIPILISIF